MAKERKTVSMDETLAEEIDRRPELNLSGVVEDFLRGYLSYGDKTSAALEARLEALERQREQLKTELDDVEAEMEEVRTLLEEQREAESHHDEVLDELAEKFPDGDQLTADNPAVRNWANKLDRRPTELVDEIEHRRNGAHG